MKENFQGSGSSSRKIPGIAVSEPAINRRPASRQAPRVVTAREGVLKPASSNMQRPYRPAPASATAADIYDGPPCVIRSRNSQLRSGRILAPHFTNLDQPVFALVNLPETVKGALFARYSRYPGSLRRLYLEEFAEDVPEGGRPFEGEEGERAAGLYERVFMGYGDDSIAQVGGAHVACEWVSNVLTKVLQRGRLAAYLEQSTRYIPYDQPLPEGSGGGYRYYRDSELGPEYERAMDELFSIYSASLETVRVWAAERWPRGEEPEGAWQRSIRAKALDLLRGLLPAATLSHVGIFASGQAYEQLLLRMMASPLPEARGFAGMILEELKKVMPSFVARVGRPDRGGEWITYLESRREAAESAVARLGLDRREDSDAPSVELVRVDGSEEELLAGSLFESASVSEREVLDRVSALPPHERAEEIAAPGR